MKLKISFVLMLKFFELEGRFPQFVEEFPQAAVDHVAGVVKVPAEDLAKYDLSSRSAKGHRTQIRETLGYRPATRADEERLTAWLADEVCPVEMVEDRLREALLVQCRQVAPSFMFDRRPLDERTAACADPLRGALPPSSGRHSEANPPRRPTLAPEHHG
jgi:hypothetical protein